MYNFVYLAIFHRIDMLLKGKTPHCIVKFGKNLNHYYMLHYIIIMQSSTFLRATRGDNYPSKMKYPSLFAFAILVLCMILIDMNEKYIHFTITKLKNPMRNIIFILIWIATIICVIYIYPKVEFYSTFWNNYLYETN
jgi:hypothetical protein